MSGEGMGPWGGHMQYEDQLLQFLYQGSHCTEFGICCALNWKNALRTSEYLCTNTCPNKLTLFGLIDV